MTQALLRQKKERGLDPRSKMILFLELDILLFLGNSFLYEIAILLAATTLMIVGGGWKLALKGLFAFALLSSISFFLPFSKMKGFFVLLFFLYYILRKFFPCLLFGRWILASTRFNEGIACLWAWKLPKEVIITLSVIFRAYPSLKEEWGAIKKAMRMRGLSWNMKNFLTRPLSMMTYFFIPLFVSAGQMSDELTAAALCRGLDRPGKHTSLIELHYGRKDVLLLAFVSLGLALVLVLKGRGWVL